MDILSRADDVDVFLPGHDQHREFDEKILLFTAGLFIRNATLGEPRSAPAALSQFHLRRQFPRPLSNRIPVAEVPGWDLCHLHELAHHKVHLCRI